MRFRENENKGNDQQGIWVSHYYNTRKHAKARQKYLISINEQAEKIQMENFMLTTRNFTC